MSFKKTTYIKPHTRNGKPVRGHLRNLGQRIDKFITRRKDEVEIKNIDDISILEVAPEVYDEIKAKVDKPLLILARADLDQEKLEKLVNSGGVDKGGNALIRNRTNGEVMKTNLIDFTAVR